MPTLHVSNIKRKREREKEGGGGEAKWEGSLTATSMCSLKALLHVL